MTYICKAVPTTLLAALAPMLVILTPQIAAAQTETIEYYASDAIGSVRVVFNASGTVIGRMDYAPFGQELYTGLLMPNERFALLTRDAEAGLDYAQARMYQVRTGRFNAPDSIYDGLLNPQNWNRYQYALNAPLALGDPEGLTPRKIVLSRDDWGKIEGFFGDYVGAAGGPWPYSEIIRLGGEWERERGQQGPRGRRRPGNPGGAGNNNTSDNTDQGNSNNGNNNSCQEFSKNLVSFVTAGSTGLLSRLYNAQARGQAMAEMGYRSGLEPGEGRTRLPLRVPGFGGFRPHLTDFGQNEDVYKHVVFQAGAALSAPATGFAFATYDAIETLGGRRGGISEMNGDVAGVGVGAAIYVWALSGDTPTLQRRVTTILCQ
jgi:RHS repeat-associated protein